MVISLQDLTEAMPRISNSIKSGDFNEFDDGIKDASGAVCALTESAAQVLGAATSVAKHTSALCNACKAASAKTNNPAAKRQFVQSAKDVANSTATLVKNIKVCTLLPAC